MQGVIPETTQGWRLQMALGHAEMTAQAMAEALGVHRGTIARWMHDEGAPPKRAYVMQWALATGTNAYWLETGKVPRPDGPDGGLEECAIRDSNPKPAAWEDTALTSSVARRTGTVSRFPVRPAAA